MDLLHLVSYFTELSEENMENLKLERKCKFMKYLLNGQFIRNF